MADLDIIEKVIVRLLRTNGVFYASLISQMRRIPLTGEQAKQLNTCGVTIKNGRIELYWNPKFFETLTLDEARAVLEHECVPAGTLITGVNKPIEQVEVGDKVLDADGKLVKVTKVMKRNYKGSLYTLRPMMQPAFQITGNHPLLVKPFQRTSKWGIKYGEPTFVPVEKLKTKDKNNGFYLLIPKIKPQKFDKILDLRPFLWFDNKSYKTLEINLDSELAWVLGYFAADGSFSQVKEGAGTFRWSGHVTKDVPNFVKVKAWFARYGYKCSLIKHKDSCKSMELQSRSSIIGRAFQAWIGKGAANKHIPDFILYNEDKKILKAFVDGFTAGDGCSLDKKGHFLMNTINPVLAYQLQLASLNLREASKVSYQKDNSGGFAKPLNNVGIFAITRRPFWGGILKDFGDYYGLPIRFLEKKPFNGLVYNLETESHTYTIQNIISHNCGHIVREHIPRFKDKDQHIANLATDLAQNQYITGLPKDCVMLDKFPKEWKLKEKQSAEYYYDEFMKHANRISVSKNPDGSYHVKITDPKGKTIAEFDVNDMDGSEWKDSDTSELSKEVVRQAVKEAVDQMKRSQGTLPQGLEVAVNEILQPPRISWNQLLRQYIAVSIKSGHKQSWKKPNRRFGATQKGRLSDHTIALGVGLDTSGSIGPEDYKIFFSELKSIQECYKADINVIECDAEVHRHYKLNKYKKAKQNVKGGGGTDFAPVFKYIKDKKLRTDVLIFFTDMCGNFPNGKYSFKTIWVSTSDISKAPFGRVICIKDYPMKGKYQ